ncbi:hypothetical protein [Citrobacter braakii]|uniref:hypothetical protein n=1 Tax=Citrobacter braakii TaxID=57706 RepID=UPI003C12C213
MLAPGLLCFRGWSHTGNLLYGVAGMLLMAGSFAIFCGALTCRHVVISFNVMMQVYCSCYLSYKRTVNDVEVEFSLQEGFRPRAVTLSLGWWACFS